MVCICSHCNSQVVSSSKNTNEQRNLRCQDVCWLFPAALWTAVRQHIWNFSEVQFARPVCSVSIVGLSVRLTAMPSIYSWGVATKHLLHLYDSVYVCIRSNLFLTCTHPFTVTLFDCRLTLFILFSHLPGTYTHSCIAQCYCASISVYLGVFFHSACACRHWHAAFHSWIKPGQRPRGLQVNVAYFKWLFLHGHSISSACMHTHSGTEKSHSRKKSLGMWFTHLFIFFQNQCVFENSLHFVTMLSFLWLQSACFWNHSHSLYPLSVSASYYFLLFSHEFLPSSFISISPLSHLS